MNDSHFTKDMLCIIETNEADKEIRITLLDSTDMEVPKETQVKIILESLSHQIRALI